jgi:hypothetical protein
MRRLDGEAIMNTERELTIDELDAVNGGLGLSSTALLAVIPRISSLTLMQ